MKYELRIETGELKRALDVIVTAINRKNALPIMSDVRIGYDRDRRLFTLTGSNTEQWIVMDAVKQDGDERRPWIFLDTDDKAAPFTAVCINALALKEAFSTLPSCPVSVSINMDKQLMRVEYNTGHFEMPVDDAAEYPMPAEIGEGIKVQTEMATQQLLPLVSAARCCVGANELRPVMSTVCIDVWHDHCVVVSSDGHTIYRRGIDTGMGWLQKADFAADANCALLLPLPALSPIIKALAGSERLQLTADERRIWMHTDCITVGTVTPEGNYPKYDSVIPRDPKAAKVIIDKAELAMALRRVSVFSNESSNMVVLKREADHMLLAADDIDFGRAATERVAIINTDTTLPDGFKIGCKISHLQELIQCIATDNVRLSLIDASRAILLFDDDDKSALTLLIMPMLVNV